MFKSLGALIVLTVLVLKNIHVEDKSIKLLLLLNSESQESTRAFASTRPATGSL